MTTSQPLLTGAQQRRLRADLNALAARLDTRRGLRRRRAALPQLYTLTGPDGPHDVVGVRAEHLDPTVWADPGQTGLALTAIALGTSPQVAGDIYGYAFAYRPGVSGHDGRPARHRSTPSVVLAVGRDAGIYLAGRGHPRAEYWAIAHGLEALVLAAGRESHTDDGGAEPHRRR